MPFGALLQCIASRVEGFRVRCSVAVDTHQEGGYQKDPQADEIEACEHCQKTTNENKSTNKQVKDS